MPTQYVYQKPGPTVVSATQSQVVNASGVGNTVVVAGRFPKGPRVGVICDAATAYSWFGQPAAGWAAGFDGPLAIQKMDLQTNNRNSTPISYAIYRVGVVCATVNVLDGSSGICFTLTAIGAWAGKAGANLGYTTAVSAGAVTNIAFYDITNPGTPILLQQLYQGQYNLTTNAAIVASINLANPEFSPFGPSGAIVSATIGASLVVPAQITSPAAFTGGSPSDGLTATGTGSDTGTKLSDQLMASVFFQAQYGVALFDGATVASIVTAHQAEALSQLQWRMFYFGPKQGTLYSSLSTTYASAASLTGSQQVFVPHDTFTISDPVTGNNALVDGWIVAAACCAVKAMGTPQDTTTRQTLLGFSQVQNTGVTGALSYNQQTGGAAGAGGLAVTSYGNGQLVIVTDPNTGLLMIQHGLTCAQRYANGGLNVFSELNAQAVDNIHNAMLVNAAQTVIGNTYRSSSAQAAAVLQTVESNASTLDSANTINGFSYQPSRPSGPAGPLQINAQYGLPVATNYINFQSGGLVLSN